MNDCFAQVFDPTKNNLLIGTRVRPMAFNFNYSAASEYVIQIKVKDISVAPVTKFGISDYKVQISSPHKVDYGISSNFFKLGLMIYFNSKEKDFVFYISESYSVCKMTHNMTMTIDDYIWGTSVYQFHNDITVTSFETELGAVFNIYKRLKGISGLTFNFINNNVNPFDKIKDFENTTSFVPGAGYGRNTAIDFFLGVLVKIN